jgi:hypothetical protein
MRERDPALPRAPRRALSWVRRYLPAELVATPSALLCAWGAGAWTGSTVAAAVAGAWGESLGFYGLMLARELRRRGRLHALPAVVRDLVLEFGPAEALDTLLVRPAFMHLGLTLLPDPVLGLVAGKLAADVGFYAPAIASFELLGYLRARTSPSRPGS